MKLMSIALDEYSIGCVYCVLSRNLREKTILQRVWII